VSDKTVIVLTSKNRLPFLRHTVEALLASERDDAIFVAVDNGSTDGSLDYLRNSKLFEKVFENSANVPHWQKSFAICQGHRFARAEHVDFCYFGWIDDDIVVKPAWLITAHKVLRGLPKIAVASMHNDSLQEIKHKTVRVEPVGNVKVRIKNTANGALWVVRRGFFNTYGLPPVDHRSVSRCSKDDDTYNQRFKGKELFGVVDDMAKHIGYKQSQRKREMRKK